jgi:hypothetical protein
MIKAKEFFTVICDSCGKDAFENGEIGAWNTRSIAEEIAIESHDYVEIKGKHYCPNCIKWDEDEEELVPI